MNSEKKINILIMGVSYIGNMASTMRISNLIDPFQDNSTIIFSNLIFTSREKLYQNENQGYKNHVFYKIINYNLYNSLSLISFLFQGYKFINKTKKKESKNILYNYGYPTIENILFILFAKLKGYKIIFDIVEDNSLIYDFKSSKGKIKNKTALFLFRNMAPFTDGCIAISNHLYQICNDVSKKRFPVYLIPISVNFKYFNQNLSIKNSRNSLKFFYGGSFGEKDGIEFLLRAFEMVAKKYRNIKLILTGTGAKRYINKFIELLERFPYKENIEYLNCLPITEYYHVLNDCDVFCMTRINTPYSNAGFPFKLGEYLATGKVVIATSVGDVPRYLKHMISAILVKPENDYSIAEAMLFCIQNPKICRRIGSNGRLLAEENFDSIRISEKLLDILYKI